ncbi:hypothetical protein CFter6_4273 [Collimonas fungivorans]|uniref:Uncharacterized protein n=1 Tax=Collimonas fungivorans TaxID=158899 RepID=A0A127PGX6_9BURK|nr:hypothetical protein CFter6_4273 [Collimonas fungivorans]
MSPGCSYFSACGDIDPAFLLPAWRDRCATASQVSCRMDRACAVRYYFAQPLTIYILADS